MKMPLLRSVRLLAAVACVLIGCVHTQRVTLVAVTDPDADVCFKACGDSSSCARACPGVTVEDGDCQGRSGRTCVSGAEVDSVARTGAIVGFGVLAIAGLISLTLAAFTPSIGEAR